MTVSFFFVQPFLGSGEASNRIVGKIKLGTETLATLDGHWDQEIYMKDKRTGVSRPSVQILPVWWDLYAFVYNVYVLLQDTSLFWNPTDEIKSKRLKRYTVPIEAQGDFESEK